MALIDTSFAKYIDPKTAKEINTSMADLERLIIDEQNKELIASLIYSRYYKRYLKPFMFNDTTYQKEYKNGFAIMTNCCLLIETFSSFLAGYNKTPKNEDVTAFKNFFEKAEKYNNPLKCFKSEPFYYSIRCGLLHQGETYQNFKIRRDGPLFNKDEKTINANEFCKALEMFLCSYKRDLTNSKWDSNIWDTCRVKLRHIIDNCR